MSKSGSSPTTRPPTTRAPTTRAPTTRAPTSPPSPSKTTLRGWQFTTRSAGYRNGNAWVLPSGYIATAMRFQNAKQLTIRVNAQQGNPSIKVWLRNQDQGTYQLSSRSGLRIITIRFASLSGEYWVKLQNVGGGTIRVRQIQSA
eukprot:CAMPEP_0184685144 /NCGR_PEP_ID=MMETSP0312-20130426/17876_1 /TAXON_ID=31354 /ORGANISM="Compsopogon coeruleus, Strain SAG 36.94" /LENGTH=143 /DNA_ID=CAMNT_0027138961 /DNA_START=95 /DNA_END=526 /DNA_ORIENTATION=-